jgi:spore coat polysaccharide biosynthesis protein SpsF
MKIIALTQARTGSTRLPGKVLKRVKGVSLLEYHIRRIRCAKKLDGVIVATTTDPSDNPIANLCAGINCKFSRGSVDDVLDRFYKAAQTLMPDYIVRLTSDCPLIDPMLIDAVVSCAIESGVDYCSNTLDPTFPDGQDVEVLRYSALKTAWENARLSSEREHVTPYIWKNSTEKGGVLFTSLNYHQEPSFGDLRMTVDEDVDFRVIRYLIETYGEDKTWREYADHLRTDQVVKDLNAGIVRNEGYLKSVNKETPKNES